MSLPDPAVVAAEMDGREDAKRRRRERFEAACAAMQGVLSAGLHSRTDRRGDRISDMPEPAWVSSCAATYADALLAALEEREQPE